MTRNTPALDVWLRFDSPEDEDASAEANTWPDGEMFRVDWCLSMVGLITSVYFHSHADAQSWLEAQGFDDYTVED